MQVYTHLEIPLNQRPPTHDVNQIARFQAKVPHKRLGLIRLLTRTIIHNGNDLFMLRMAIIHAGYSGEKLINPCFS